MIRVDYSGLNWDEIGFKLSEKCKYCGGKVFLADDYDAKFCSSCGRWLEKTCGSPYCEYCRDRPKNAIQALNMKKYIIDNS